MEISNPADKIILAIDGLDLYQAIKFLKNCPRIKWVKVGLELFSQEGPYAIEVFKKMNKKIFLDLKFHDIPNTMKSACYQVSKLGVDMISLHTSAGFQALKESKEATLIASKEISKKPPDLIGVTVLTSFSNQSFQRELNIKTSIEEYVSKLARLSFDAGLDGCVCSPCEVKELRKNYNSGFKLITPGIRLIDNNNNDQSRVMTPFDALSNGASQLVIGRPITNSKDPNHTFIDILKSIS